MSTAADVLASMLASSLVNHSTPASGVAEADAQLALANVGGRSVLFGVVEKRCASAIASLTRFADRLGVSSVIVAPNGLDEPLLTPAQPHRAPHVLIVAPTTSEVLASLAACQLLHVTLAPNTTASSVPTLGLLEGGSIEETTELALLLLSYLPEHVGEFPRRFAAEASPESEPVAAAVRAGNAIEAFHRLCDDVLRVLPGATDELVFALGRISGASAMLISAQPMASPTLGHGTLVRLALSLELSSHWNLPVVVLGSIPELANVHDASLFATRSITVHLSAMTRPVIVVNRATDGSWLDTTLARAPTAIRIGDDSELHASITLWIANP